MVFRIDASSPLDFDPLDEVDDQRLALWDGAGMDELSELGWVPLNLG